MNVDDLAGPAGVLEGLLDEPASPRAGVVFAHPLPSQGGTMHTKAVFQGAKGLTRIGCAVLRFNFRGVGLSQGQMRSEDDSPDQGSGELDDYKTALDWMAARYPGLPLWAAGFSFGAWVALETGAADPRVAVLIGIAPPVNRTTYSFTQTLASTKPKFLIQGSLDELCPLKEMWAFYAKLKEPRELVVIDGANHLFEGKTEEVGEALADLLGDFE
jgi:alpha/beta superfamily hydrolase